MRIPRPVLALLLCPLGLLAASCARPARTVPADVAPPPPVRGYRLVWHDEFGGAALDTAKWTAYPGERRDARNDPDAAAVAGGTLTLATWTADGVHHTGFMDTAGKFAATYGYFEARIRFATSPGEWGAFWLQSPTMGTPPDDGAEVDVLEHRVTDAEGRDIANRYGINVHWDGYGDAHQHAGGEGAPANGAAHLQGGWHTYAVLWTRERYVFYLDGVEQWATSQGVSHRSEFIKVTCEVQDRSWAGHIPVGGYGPRAGSATSMQVDWVRVWQPAS
jgi:beta-glucanase (GH16 family)